MSLLNWQSPHFFFRSPHNTKWNRLTWHKTDILWNLLKIRWKGSKKRIRHKKNWLGTCIENVRVLVLIIIKWKAVLILFALFSTKISYYSIGFHSFDTSESIYSGPFFVPINRFKSEWIVLFIFCFFLLHSISLCSSFMFYISFIYVILTHILCDFKNVHRILFAHLFVLLRTNTIMDSLPFAHELILSFTFPIHFWQVALFFRSLLFLSSFVSRLIHACPVHTIGHCAITTTTMRCESLLKYIWMEHWTGK